MQGEYDRLRIMLEEEKDVLLRALQADRIGGGGDEEGTNQLPTTNDFQEGLKEAAATGTTSRYSSTAFTTMALYDAERERMKKTVDAHLLKIVQDVKDLQERLYREIDRLVETRVSSIRALNDRFRTVTAALKQTMASARVNDEDSSSMVTTMMMDDDSSSRHLYNDSLNVSAVRNQTPSSSAISSSPSRKKVSTSGYSFFASHFFTTKSSYSKFSPTRGSGGGSVGGSGRTNAFASRMHMDTETTLAELEHSLKMLRKVKEDEERIPEHAKTLLTRLTKVVEANKRKEQLRLAEMKSAEFFGREFEEELEESGGFRLHLHSKYSSLDLGAIHVSDSAVPSVVKFNPKGTKGIVGFESTHHRSIRTPRDGGVGEDTTETH